MESVSKWEGRKKRAGILIGGLVVCVACFATIVVLSPKSVQYNSLDPYKPDAGESSSELLQEYGGNSGMQDPYEAERFIISRDAPQLAARDAAASRLALKARRGADAAQRSSAAQLLEEARAALAKRGPSIQALISSAKRLDSSLLNRAPTLHRAQDQVVQQRRSAGARGGRTSGLYYTNGGYGPYPDDDDDSSSSGFSDNWDDEEGPAVAEVTDGDYPEPYGASYGPVDDWRSSIAPAVTAIGAAVKSLPLQWFISGSPQATVKMEPLVVQPAVNHPRPLAADDGREESDEGEDQLDWPASGEEGEQGPSTPVLDRVQKLIDLKRQADGIQSQQSQVLDDVYADAENGNMARVGSPPEAAAFSQGFLEGAVEASKKSMEQQAEFAAMLQRQEEIVQRLEGAVRELEEHQRQENWAKTAAQYPAEAPLPPPAPAAAPAPPPPPAPVAAPPAPAPAPAPPAPAPAAEKKRLVTGQPEQKPLPLFNIDFYMEAMCPGCMHFTTTVLAPVLSAMEDYVELRAIPFGNAAITNGTVQCQHGADECTGNKIELCMMKQYPGWRTWFPAFKCIEASDEVPLVAARTCLADHGMDAERLIACALSKDADAMQLEAGNETISLDPPHEFTPWVVVNGEPVGDQVMDLQAWLCGKLAEEQRGEVAACSPSKYRDAKRLQTLRGTHGKAATTGFCYPSLKWDGAH